MAVDETDRSYKTYKTYNRIKVTGATNHAPTMWMEALEGLLSHHLRGSLMRSFCAVNHGRNFTNRGINAQQTTMQISNTLPLPIGRDKKSIKFIITICVHNITIE
jgi:protein-L-isoaspartate O-methyltransferase